MHAQILASKKIYELTSLEEEYSLQSHHEGCVTRLVFPVWERQQEGDKDLHSFHVTAMLEILHAGKMEDRVTLTVSHLKVSTKTVEEHDDRQL